jgi:hypothetical protein
VKGTCLEELIALWPDSSSVWWRVPEVFDALQGLVVRSGGIRCAALQLEGRAATRKGPQAKPFSITEDPADIIVQPAA